MKSLVLSAAAERFTRIARKAIRWLADGTRPRAVMRPAPASLVWSSRRIRHSLHAGGHHGPWK